MRRLLALVMFLLTLAHAEALYRLQLQGVPLIHQTYNACGPAALVETLGYWGIHVPLATVSAATRPNDRAYMTAAAIPPLAAQYGLEARLYRNGRVDVIRALLLQGVPVIALTWLQQVGKIPHWRVITGFDDGTRRLFVHDPLLGFVSISYDDFTALWATQGTLFAVLYPPSLHRRIIQAIGA